MPPLSRFTLRVAVVYLIAGATLGSLALIGKAIPAYSQWIGFFPLHIVWMVIGGFVQFTLGTAFWILPKFSDRPSFYGNVPAMVLSIVAINGGIFVYTLNFVFSPGGEVALAARLLWLMGAIGAGIHLLPRIKPFQRK